MPLANVSDPTLPPKHYLLALYPAHQLLDSAGPLDILNTVSKQTSHPHTDITITVVAETLDPPPLTVTPPRTARGSWSFESTPELNPLRTGANVNIAPDITYADLLAQLEHTAGSSFEVTNAAGDKETRRIDVLLIPGGIGSRLNRVYADGRTVLNVAHVIDFARKVCLNGWITHAVLTVCTGSDLFARTGLLNGRRACTNHLAFKMVSERHGGVKFLRGRRWVRSLPGEVQVQAQGEELFEREVWTGAGISAGMDLALWFVSEVYEREFARGIARRLEYEWREGVGEGEVDPYYD